MFFGKQTYYSRTGGRFSVIVRKVVISQRKSINNYKTDAKNTQNTEPSTVLLIDCENNIPFFMGTMTDMDG